MANGTVMASGRLVAIYPNWHNTPNLGAISGSLPLSVPHSHDFYQPLPDITYGRVFGPSGAHPVFVCFKMLVARD